MKKILLFCWLLLLSYNSQAQGKDVIFWVDNSGSTSGPKYENIKTSVQALMTKILSCPNNRVTVIQHAGNAFNNPASTRIWIESPFTTTAFTFDTRNLGSYDYAHNALGLIGNALDHVPNSSILGFSNLTKLPNNQLVIFFFTDSDRDFNSSALVNLASPTVSTNGAFTNYTLFKSNRNANFRVILCSNSNGTNIPTAAAIANQGGPYTGVRESYPNDSEGLNPTQRRLYMNSSNNFSLSNAEINAMANDLCSVTFPTNPNPDPCPQTLNLTSPVLGTDNKQAEIRITASNSIGNSGIAVYHAGTEVVLSQGFHSATGSRFRGYILGCSNTYVGREVLEDEETKGIAAVNDMKIYPNPSSSIVSIESLIEMTNVNITSIDGRSIFTKSLPNVQNFDMNVSSYKAGIYLVNIEFSNGEIISKKLIKN